MYDHVFVVRVQSRLPCAYASVVLKFADDSLPWGDRFLCLFLFLLRTGFCTDIG